MKKIVVMLLALVMVFGLAAPAMALELKELDDVQIGGNIEVPSVPDESDDDDDVNAQAIVTPVGTTTTKKPSKLTSTYVNKMKIDVYYYYSQNGEPQGTFTPSKGGKLFKSGTGYTINDVVEVEESDPYYGTYEWKTSVTFHFAAGDEFIQSANDTLNTQLKSKIGTTGNWVYQFSEAYPADQTVTFYRVGNNWTYVNSAGTITKFTTSTANINIGHIVRAQVRLEGDDVETYTVTYTDGLGGSLFRNQSKVVKAGNATPAFTGNTNAGDSYLFLGWSPEVAETVTADALYTAQWKIVKKATITFNGNGGKTNKNFPSYKSEKIEVGTEINLATVAKNSSNYGAFIKSLSSDNSTNYHQVGWNTQADGKGTHYDMDATITMFDTDTTLYAEWEGYEWIHWNVTLGQGGESITHHINNSTAVYYGDFKMYCGNVGTSYGKVPKAYYTPVEVTASEDWEFAGWYDGETLVSDNAKLTSTAVGNLRKLTLAESGAVLEARFNHTACKEHLEFVKTVDEPTCTEVGHDLYKCSVCNVEYTVDVPALGHSLLSGWIHNRKEHWHKCTRCGELLDVAEHNFTEWTSVYGEKNKEERHCTVCSYSEVAETVKVNANGSSSKPASSEENPNTGAEVPSVLPAIAVLAAAAVVLGKKR